MRCDDVCMEMTSTVHMYVPRYLTYICTYHLVLFPRFRGVEAKRDRKIAARLERLTVGVE